MNIILGITGSVAAYKACELASRLRQRGDSVKVVMTTAGTKFVTPVNFRAVTGNPVYVDMFLLNQEGDSPVHINLAEWADLLVIAPATANVIGKIANGIADNLLTTIALSVKVPVIIAPAMNENMFLNPVVQKNLAALRTLGIHIVEPETGFLACGYTGKGRLASIEKIIAVIDKFSDRQ